MTLTTLADGPLIRWLAAHWEPLLLAVLLLGTAFWVFRSALAQYNYIFFPARAVRNAFLKALAMTALLYAIYAVPDWLAQVLLPPGKIRSLSFVVSILLFDALWDGASRRLDRLFVGR